MIKHRIFSQSFIFSIFMLVTFLQPANAGMVGTLSLLPENSLQNDVNLIRLGIQNQLVDLGVDQQQAEIRVASMTDSQINELSQKLNELPAGASAGGILLTVFIVFCHHRYYRCNRYISFYQTSPINPF